MNPKEILSNRPIKEENKPQFETYLSSVFPIVSVHFTIDPKKDVLKRADAFFQLAENILNYCIDYSRRKNMIGILNISHTETDCLIGYDTEGFNVGRTTSADYEILDFILNGDLAKYLLSRVSNDTFEQIETGLLRDRLLSAVNMIGGAKKQGPTSSGFLLVRSAVESLCRRTDDHHTKKCAVENRIARSMLVAGIYCDYNVATNKEKDYQELRDKTTHSSRIYVDEKKFEECYNNATKLIEQIFLEIKHNMIPEDITLDDFVDLITKRYHKYQGITSGSTNGC
jgi:hypothetical protein